MTFWTTLCCGFGVGALQGWFWQVTCTMFHLFALLLHTRIATVKQRLKTHCERDQLHCTDLKMILEVPKQNTVVLLWPGMCECHGGSNSWDSPDQGNHSSSAAGISLVPLSWNKARSCWRAAGMPGGGDSHCSSQDTLQCFSG